MSRGILMGMTLKVVCGSRFAGKVGVSHGCGEQRFAGRGRIWGGSSVIWVK